MKAILVDDEPLALEFLEIQLKKASNIDLIKKLTHLDINEHKDLLEKIDLIFLDIEMPGKNGLELGEQVLEINPNIEIVFVTAYDQYAVQAFELHALDYVLKPVQVDRLKKTLARLNIHKDQMKQALPESTYLHINVCGELTFETEENTYETIPWRTAKAQELFLYLLHYAGKTVRKSELVELLWPEFEQQRGYSQLYTTIYNIRKTLNKFNSHLSIKSVQIGYTLIIQNVLIDIVEWENEITSAPPIHIETVELYEKIMDQYTGLYLGDYDYLWAEAERFRLEQLWIKAAKKIANCYKQNNYLEEAVKWYSKICDLRPDDEQANFSLMKLYAALEYGLLVHHQYEQLKQELAELSIEVSYEIKKWYEHWRVHK